MRIFVDFEWYYIAVHLKRQVRCEGYMQRHVSVSLSLQIHVHVKSVERHVYVVRLAAGVKHCCLSLSWNSSCTNQITQVVCRAPSTTCVVVVESEADEVGATG